MSKRTTNPDDPANGLTKREEFARSAMQGLLAADTEACMSAELAANIAVAQADALIAELNQRADDETQ